MIEAVTRWFPPPAPAEPIKDPKIIEENYRYWRIRILYAMFLGYAFYYFTRGTFAIAMPELKKMGIDEVSLGWTATLFQLSYAVSKFTSGIIADRSNPRYFMAIGLILTGIINIVFGLCTSIFLLAILWALNGWFQGWGSAPCHRLLTHWYSQSERGRWWSFWNTAHNAGAAVLPLIAAPIIGIWGWIAGMWLPGILAIIGGFILINRLRDTPQSLGLPRVETFRKDNPQGLSESESERELGTREILFEHVLNNPYIWLLALGFFCIQTTRWAISQWSYHYLVTEQGYTNWAAAKCIFWFEAGGFIGGIVAGWISDIVFQGKRGPINVIFSVCLIPAIFGLGWVTGQASLFWMTESLMALCGFFIFGPHMMAMVAAAEIAHKKASATAVGFLGIIAYLGCSLTGGPLGHIIRDWGWEYFFRILEIGGITSALCFLPLWAVGTKRAKAAAA
jgi:OPA family sugar phosphate sensor protein UhpC-like MFS transporter